MGGPSAPTLSAAMLQDAVGVILPQPAQATPPATALDSSRGTAARFALEDHTHATKVQRVVMVTAADGTVTWTFARPIAVPTGKMPPVAYMVEDAGSPVVVQVIGRTFISDVAAGIDTHTAVTVRAQRSRPLPATISSLLVLAGYDVFQLASGVRIDLWAADPTQ